MSSTSNKNKRLHKKIATSVLVNSSSSPFSQFPRIVIATGVLSPTLAVTIPQAFQEQQALLEQTAIWHAEVRQKLINGIAQLPGAPTPQVLSALSSISAQSSWGFWFGRRPCSPRTIAIVSTFQISLRCYPSQHQLKVARHWVWSLGARFISRQRTSSFTYVINKFSIHTCTCDHSQSIFSTDSNFIEEPSSFSSSWIGTNKRDKIDSIQSVYWIRSGQSITASIDYRIFVDLIQANSVQKLVTSSLIDLNKQRSSKSGVVSTARVHQPGLATNTRPGMVTVSQRKDFVVVPILDRSKKVVSSAVITNVPAEPLSTFDVLAPSHHRLSLWFLWRLRLTMQHRRRRASRHSSKSFRDRR